MDLYAHLTKINNARKEHTLKDHLYQSARYASLSMGDIGLEKTAYLCGLLHDMGKATKRFNEYIEKAFSGEKVVRGSVNHTFAGAIYILEKFHNEGYELITSEIIAFVVGSHHGMFDCVDFDGKSGLYYRLEKNKDDIFYYEAKENYFSEIITEEEVDGLFWEAETEIEKFLTKIKEKITIEDNDGDETYFHIMLLCRLLLSSLIYADRRDTREFFENINSCNEREISWKEDIKFLEKKIKLFNQDSEINRVRMEISNQCLNFASNENGIYTLNIPTGAGKTLSSLRYSLAHADLYKKKRIIFVIPLLSILDQNAKIIRDNLFHKEWVLEHHSNVINEIESGGELDFSDLLSGSWEEPIVISTLVQLLNILFDGKTSSIERMKSLCDSVIVIDEVQSIPNNLIMMFNAAMNFLSFFCNTTIVLSSATQPCFEKVGWPIRYANNRSIVKISSEQENVFKRNDVVDKTTEYGYDEKEFERFCLDIAQTYESMLVVCNTKRQARDLYSSLKEKFIDAEIFHLSTAMCKSHRMAVLEEVREKLANIQNKKNRVKKKIICISTQLVEAGVDFSFETVIRVMAGMDNLVQAAGRCNRSNEYGGGTVFLVNLKNEKLTNLKTIKQKKQSTVNTLQFLKSKREENIVSDLALERYYKSFFNNIKEEMRYEFNDSGNKYYMTKILSRGINPVRRHNRIFLKYPFKSASEEFKVFDEKHIDLIVPYGEGINITREFIFLENNNLDYFKYRDLVKKAKSYIVNIYENQKNMLVENGHVEVYCGGRVLVLKSEIYDENYGLAEIKEKKVEEFIF